MFNKFVLIFFMFGCWLKYLEYPANIILHNIWGTLVVAWIILNVLGMFSYVLKRKPKIQVNQKTQTAWLAHNLVATLSFYTCGEFYLTIAFLLSSVTFMFIVLFTQDGKKTRK